MLLLLFGRRKRERNFEFSFVRCFHCIIIIISRRENDTIINNNSRKRERERDLWVWARVFVDFCCRASLSSIIEEEEET